MAPSNLTWEIVGSYPKDIAADSKVQALKVQRAVMRGEQAASCRASGYPTHSAINNIAESLCSRPLRLLLASTNPSPSNSNAPLHNTSR
jgi:hypothetical protein